MKADCKIAVVIPCYDVRDEILEVLRSIPDWVDMIIVVDDACPQGTGAFTVEHFDDPRLRVVSHTQNRGVGGAMRSGFRTALEIGADILVKLDGDGQMDPAHMTHLVRPLCQANADLAKGNRFFDFHALQRMPTARRVGNMGLTLLMKAASGYWDVSDPTNGYFAIHRSAVELLPLDRLDEGYFFECSLLVHLNIIRAVVTEVPLPAKYDREPSHLDVGKALLVFPPKLVRAGIRRVVWRYFVYNMNAVTLFLLAGGILTVGSLLFGGYRWYLGIAGAQQQTAGTVALGLFPAIVGMQMLLQAMILDILDRAVTPIQTKWLPGDG